MIGTGALKGAGAAMSAFGGTNTDFVTTVENMNKEGGSPLVDSNGYPLSKPAGTVLTKKTSRSYYNVRDKSGRFTK